MPGTPNRRIVGTSEAPASAPLVDASAPTSTVGDGASIAVATTATDGRNDVLHGLPAQPPLTRRRARELAKPGVAASGVDTESAEPIAESRTAAELAAAEAITVEGAESSTVDAVAPAEALTVEGAESSTADALLEDFTLVEPLTAEPLVDEVFSTAQSTSAAHDDEFEAAARLFSFTDEIPVSVAALSESPKVTYEPVSAAVHVIPRRRRMSGAAFKRVAAASFSVGVMGIVGLLTVGMTTPAQAVAAPGSASVANAEMPAAGDAYGTDAGEIQAYVAPSDVQAEALDRTENYSTGTLVDLAGTEGIQNYSSSVFQNNPNCSIQWPFATGVTMSYGFGMRSGRMHEGIDFTPGAGAHIQAIDDGVVRISTDSGGAFGVTILIDHVVDGQLVSSRYAHMQYGSRQVQVGDHVSVGEFIGRTGNTGRSFGAHTHVEILQNGTTPIDPLPWFRSHATC